MIVPLVSFSDDFCSGLGTLFFYKKQLILGRGRLKNLFLDGSFDIQQNIQNRSTKHLLEPVNFGLRLQFFKQLLF